MSTTIIDSLRIHEYGDAAVLIESTEVEREVQWAAVQSVGALLRDAALPGIENVIATFDSLVVTFDPLTVDADMLTRWIREHGHPDGAMLGSGRTYRIPVLYGGGAGPDLVAVAAELDLTVSDFVDLHSSARWRVAFIGAPGGAPLHEGSPFDRPIPRMTEPRIRVAAGTIAVAGFQGAIYTIPTPGGWRCIGQTPLKIIDPYGERFLAIRPGDVLEFRPISEREFASAPRTFVGDVESLPGPGDRGARR